MNEQDKAALFHQMRSDAAACDYVADLLSNNCGALTAILLEGCPIPVNRETAHKLAHVMIDAVATFGEGLAQCADDAEKGDEKAMECIVNVSFNKGDTRH